MSQDAVSFVWTETDEGVRVSFPPPDVEESEESPIGCAVATFVFALLIALVAVLLITWKIVEQLSIQPAEWVAYAVVVVVIVGMLLYARSGVRQARVSSAIVKPATEPSVLSIDDRELKIERVGKDRGSDVRWLRGEIADIRLCQSASDRVFVSIGGMLKHALSGDIDNSIRISVMLPSGEVEDVWVLAPCARWIEELETRLREYLGLTSADEN